MMPRIAALTLDRHRWAGLLWRITQPEETRGRGTAQAWMLPPCSRNDAKPGIEIVEFKVNVVLKAPIAAEVISMLTEPNLSGVRVPKVEVTDSNRRLLRCECGVPGLCT